MASQTPSATSAPALDPAEWNLTHPRRTRLTLRFAWYDMWVGVFIDRPKRTLYVCPLPCVLVTVRRG